MKKKINMDILKQSDALTEDRIAEQFPAKWDMEHIYEKSVQKYLQRSGNEPTRVQTSRKQMYRMIAMAACLLLTVGLGVGVWSKQQRIETRPPQETQTTTVTQTETRTETTAQTLTTSQTTVSQTETSAKATESAINTTLPVSETALLTTEPKSEKTVFTSLQTKTTEVSTEPIVPFISDTTQPQICEIVQSSLTANLQTRPIATESIMTEPHRTETIATGQTTEVSETQTTEYVATTAQLPGFWISKPNVYGMVDVTYQESVAPSPVEQYQYELHLESCAVHEISLEGAAFKTLVDRINLRVEAPSGSHFLGIVKRDVFQFYCDEDAVLKEVSINENPGVFIIGTAQCMLVWDDGFYKLTMTGKPEDQELMLEIAQNLVPVLPENEDETSITETNFE
ncbi:MAG: hypothetical protein IJ906_07690 [Oscillospiraceae bacterium]|nr:hypothetical protein [Oscillospiraceae bacterium]